MAPFATMILVVPALPLKGTGILHWEYEAGSCNYDIMKECGGEFLMFASVGIDQEEDRFVWP